MDDHLNTTKVYIEKFEPYLEWHKTSDVLPTDTGYNYVESQYYCYGLYLGPDGHSEVQDHIIYDHGEGEWTWEYEAGSGYFSTVNAPDYWAYQILPKGPACFIGMPDIGGNKNDIEN